MENRERDRVSQRTTPTEAGRINRQVEEEKGREQNSGTSAEFGQNIGRSENLEGGTMDNNKRSGMNNPNSDLDRESSRRPGSDYNSSVGRSSGSEIQDTGKRSGGSTGEMGNSDSNRSSRNIDSSEGRH